MVTEAILNFLKEKSDYSSFFHSLLSQFERKGSLSERQLECVEQAMAKEGLKAAPDSPTAPVVPRTFTLPVGERIEIKRKTANFLKRKLKMNVFFSNLEIVKVIDENNYGYRVDVRFVSGVCTHCHCCGKDLDVDVSKASGIGPVCAKKYFGVKRPTVEMAQKILELLDRYCLQVGVIQDVWIRKENINARLGQAHSPDSNIVAERQIGDMVGAVEPTAAEIWQKAQKDAKELRG